MCRGFKISLGSWGKSTTNHWSQRLTNSLCDFIKSSASIHVAPKVEIFFNYYSECEKQDCQTVRKLKKSLPHQYFVKNYAC